jgi:hypothetical protein
MTINRMELEGDRIECEGAPVVTGTAHELLDQFKLAFADENAAEFVRLISELENKIDGTTFIALLRRIDVLLRFHGDLLKKWCEEDPGIAKAMQQLGQLLQRRVNSEQ